MNKYLFAVGALAVLATACTKPIDNCDTSDSAECEDSATETGDTSVEGCAEYTGDFSMGLDPNACSVPDGNPVDYASWACDPATNDFWYEVYTIGWASNIELYIDQDSGSPWTEYHNSDDLVDINVSYESFDADGYWDYYYLYLDYSDDYTEVQDDPTKTLYVCGESRISTLSWFFIANADADSSVDCVALEDSDGIFDQSGCSAPSWI